MCLLAIRSGYIPTMRVVRTKTPNHQDQWIGRYTVNGRQDRLQQQDSNFIYRPVRSVKTYYTRRLEVHDLTVEGDHSFTVGFATAHNCHRIGQHDNVLVKHWVLKDSHDAKMVATLVRKQEVLDKALDDEKKELTEEPVISTEHRSLATRKQLRIEASVLTPAQASNVLTCLISLRDNTEVEQVDGEVRDALASKASLSPMAAALGRKVVLRYRQHCAAHLVLACGGWQGEEKTVFGR
jgi:hypothetical protein